jgi:glucosyl-dolichyl phosphate glucuronosyltransferase
MNNSPDISIIIPTFNRQDLLGSAIRSVLDQNAGSITFELIVVDNNSSDDTSGVVRTAAKETTRSVRYFREPKQGVSHARNLGISHARAPILGFLDDDVQAAPDWTACIKDIFDRRPRLGFVGGKVVPAMIASVPTWLTSVHWAPLALLDYGDEPIELPSPTGLGLITANCAIRKSVFEREGLFRPELQRIGNNLGSMEDHELFERFMQRGVKGLYVPELIVATALPPSRLTKEYHRAWHFQHGRFYAIHASIPVEPPGRGRLFGVPAYLYRQAITDACLYVKHRLLIGIDHAFQDEIKLRFFAGFVSRRIADRYPILAENNPE